MAAEYPTLAEVAEQHHKVDVYMPRVQTRCSCGQWYPGTHGQHIADKWRESCTVTTPEQLDALPPEVIVKSEGGTVACRYYDRIHGVTFGDERPFTWTVLASELPAVVLWHPLWGA